MRDVPITYILVEELGSEHRATVFQLLSESEVALLRCFMTLLLLPASTSRILAEQPPFVESVTRLRRLPMFRKTTGESQPHPQLWEDMLNSPLLVLMVTGSLPSWFEHLAQLKKLAL